LPIGAYTVTNGGSSILKPTAKCENVDAYSVYRGTFISVDTSESVNTQGDKKDVISYFQPENGEITKGQRITHQFKKLGCTYMDIITEDTRTTKNDRVRIRFVVNNNLPTM
jgi:hypothetical protein